MNIVLFDPEEIGRPLAASDPRADHLQRVLKRAVGDAFDAGIVNGLRGKGTVRRVGASGIEWDFAPTGPGAPLYPIELIVGMPRPQTARKILQEATALGVRAIRFVETEKGDPGYGRSTLWSSGEWRRHVRAGLEQAFATVEPVVTHGETLDEAGAAVATAATAYALDNYEANSALGSGPSGAPSAVFVGGERGWSAGERNFFRSKGILLRHLGPRVLRTETACVAAIAILRAW